MVKGVLDRIVDDEHAVILVEQLGKEFVISSSLLPEGSKEGTWFTLVLNEDTIVKMDIDQVQTDFIKGVIDDKLNKLRSKSKGSRFKRS